MPAFQTMMGELNKHLDTIDPELFAPDREFTEAADELGVTRMAGVAPYINTIPVAVAHSMRAAIYSALTREPRMAVTIAWAPGYDFEVDIWEAPGTSETPGGVTILFKSRYPSDAHPISGEAAG